MIATSMRPRIPFVSLDDSWFCGTPMRKTRKCFPIHYCKVAIAKNSWVLLFRPGFSEASWHRRGNFRPNYAR